MKKRKQKDDMMDKYQSELSKRYASMLGSDVFYTIEDFVRYGGYEHKKHLERFLLDNMIFIVWDAIEGKRYD